MKWAHAAIEYAFGKADGKPLRTNDPREILGYLDGGDRLLNGSFFKDLEDIQKSYQLFLEQEKLFQSR